MKDKVKISKLLKALKNLIRDAQAQPERNGWWIDTPSLSKALEVLKEVGEE